ncbi:hypothetical protein [Streptomyces antarcticus]|uniref:hypothetical protein n=1 Tax=Streptomyces antarcticus TaxID=2996458 RepID=UPI00226F8363|nr:MULTISPECIES: hypothetical protein [unclassified Streptomyces]MCY0947351.1 hypothetical protein [Streptomyces sp. H34-AA3]MCY0954674.1 hypothetical protein [Streptomyces sp. H27-S2]MCZ4086478.1 hypothetical protein [Streptomyces sp. H34-S5]
MSSATNATRVEDGYAQQISGDLAANHAAQEQARAELLRLQEELGQLEDSEKVLVKMQNALGVSAKPASAPAAKRGTKRAAVPSARSASRGAGKAAEPRTAAAAKPPRARKAAVKDAVKKEAVKKEAVGPSWLDLVTAAVAGQSEPKSVGEVADAVGAAHPGRKVQPTIIRNTLEQGVARGLLERSKQGRSVYYTRVAAAPADPDGGLSPAQPA